MVYGYGIGDSLKPNREEKSKQLLCNYDPILASGLLHYFPKNRFDNQQNLNWMKSIYVNLHKF